MLKHENISDAYSVLFFSLSFFAWKSVKKVKADIGKFQLSQNMHLHVPHALLLLWYELN